MSRIRGKDTKPEMVVRSLVHRLGYRFRLHRKDLPGKPDLVFVRLKKVIFVHGCFWHLHNCKYGRVKPATNAAFWEDKRLSTQRRDRKNIRSLKSLGWDVMVVWQCQIKQDNLIERLDAFLSASNAATGR